MNRDRSLPPGLRVNVGLALLVVALLAAQRFCSVADARHGHPAMVPSGNSPPPQAAPVAAPTAPATAAPRESAGDRDTMAVASQGDNLAWCRARVHIPVAFLAPPAGLGQFNSDELAALERLQQSFRDAVADAGFDPASPEYLETWLKAQDTSDDQFSALFGAEAFVQQQIVAVQAAPSGR